MGNKRAWDELDREILALQKERDIAVQKWCAEKSLEVEERRKTIVGKCFRSEEYGVVTLDSVLGDTEDLNDNAVYTLHVCLYEGGVTINRPCPEELRDLVTEIPRADFDACLQEAISRVRGL